MKLVKILDNGNISVYLNPMTIKEVYVNKMFDSYEMAIKTESGSIITTRDAETLDRLGRLFNNEVN